MCVCVRERSFYFAEVLYLREQLSQSQKQYSQRVTDIQVSITTYNHPVFSVPIFYYISIDNRFYVGKLSHTGWHSDGIA